MAEEMTKPLIDAVAYARFSSNHQRDESIDAQLRDIRSFAKSNGIRIIAEYADKAFSARSDQRPDFQRMIKDAKEHKFQVVIVHKLDRFSRDRYDSAFYKRELKNPVFWILLVLAAIAAAVGTVILLMRAKLRSMHRRQQEYKSIVEQALHTFANAIDAKDKYTNGHSMRVARYSRELAKRMGMSEGEQEHIYYVALMHDIGKIGIPDEILNKPGILTEEERRIIQTHVDIGGDILKDFTALQGITDGARYHHERFDGKGYSKGLAGTDIPKLARIIGVADTYDAMSSDRCYRRALSEDIIIDELNKFCGTQFDPDVVPHMLEMIKDGTAPYKG